MRNREQQDEETSSLRGSLIFTAVFAKFGFVPCWASCFALASEACICTHDAGCTAHNKPGLPAIIRYLVCVLKVS